MNPRNTPKDWFNAQKAGAKRRAIPFLLTFEQWLEVWTQSGHWHERGRKRGQYVMARPGDQGPYELGNVEIVRSETNLRSKKLSAEARAKVSRANLGRPSPLRGVKRLAETIAKMRAANLGKKASEAARAKMGLANLGRRHTTETCAKISAANYKRWNVRRIEGVT